MTIRQQIALGLTLIFLLMALGLTGLGLHNSKKYVEQQLASHAQDAASALSLPVAQALAAKDRVTAEVLIAAMFDRGYYQQIMVLSNDGAKIIKRELPREISGVPAWFSGFIEIETQAGEAFLSNGWQQLGKIVVISQPTFAYKQAWSALINTLIWTSLIFILMGLLLAFLLRVIFRPLDRVASAAHAIVNRQFDPITPLPKAKELSGVVNAINLMSASIKNYLDEEEARSENFRREAYFDAVTGLQNRRAFDLLMRQRLSNTESSSDGALIMVAFEGLNELNHSAGYPEGNQLLQEISATLSATLSQHAESISRIGGATFTAVLFDCNEATVKSLSEQLCKNLTALTNKPMINVRLSSAVGVSFFAAHEKLGQIMARTDLALEMAKHDRNGAIAYSSAQDSDHDTLGSQGWRQLIQMALKEQRWVLHAQPLIDLQTGAVVHKEIMARLLDHSGQLIAANMFLPMATRHQLMPDIDRALIELALQRAESATTSLAINISRQAIESKEFVYADLVKQVKKIPSHQLAFEMSEYSFVRNIGAAKALFDSLRGAGCKVGIDRFGIDISSIHLLRSYPPDYIKLDGGLVSEIIDHADSAELVRMIVHLSETLNVQVYAQGVQQTAIADLLKDFGVRAGQGYLFGEPALI